MYQKAVRLCMRDIILELMGEYGNLAVFLLILIENLFPPIPSEVILTFGGVMTTCTEMSVSGVVFASTCGSLLGAVILYLAGYLIPQEAVERIVAGPVGKFLHFEAEDVTAAKEWFSAKGTSAVFLCRLVPIVRSLISIPAGISGMNPASFLILTAAGSLIWNTVLVLLGKAAGDSWELVSERFGIYSDVFLIILGVGVLTFAVFRQIKAKQGED